MAALKRVVAWLLAAALSLVIVTGGVFVYAKGQYEAPGPLAEDKTLVIDPGTSVQAIGETLADAGVISDPRLFFFGARLTDQARALKAGEYLFPAQVSVENSIAILVNGKTVQHRVTVPEGTASVEAIRILEGERLLTGDIDAVPAEGSLLPETYSYTRGETRGELIGRMQAAMDALVAELWADRREGLPFDTPEDAVILASIVQKESGILSEKPLIAGVFVNRLERGMRLQSDPTVIYGMTKGEPLGRKLFRNDLRRESPWNTYRINGLPPTPITNPGRAALEAVLDPEETDYLYFVADGSGGHAFARTLAEHNRNVAKWRKIRDGGE
ncbi:MAG: endolytic transglycosylase MltG [Alphaproteobacteria bacterium]|nr:endolytic transglycosylase MltG [Alphaproteobacteria bacterium]